MHETYTAGDPQAALAHGQIVLVDAMADQLGVGVGGHVTLAAPGSPPVGLTIGAIQRQEPPGASMGRVRLAPSVGLDVLSTLAPTASDTALFAFVAGGADPAAVGKTLTAALAGYPQLAVQDRAAYKAFVRSSADQRQRTDHDLLDPGNTGLGHRDVVRWNDPGQWVISEHQVHPALVSEQDFVAIQGMRAEREDARHAYRLTGLLRCTLCQRSFEGHWVHDTPGYRCRHGHTSAKKANHDRPKNAYLPEKRITAKLPLLHHLLTTNEPATHDARATASAATSCPPAKTPEEVIDYLRDHGLELAYDPRTRTLEIPGKSKARTTL